jgi:hypothetical protein
MYLVYGYGGNFGEDDAAQRIRKGEVNVPEDEVDVDTVCLLAVSMSRGLGQEIWNLDLSNGYRWASIGPIHGNVIIHDGGATRVSNGQTTDQEDDQRLIARCKPRASKTWMTAEYNIGAE